MAPQLELSILSENPRAGEAMRPILADFEWKQQVHVNVSVIPCRHGYKEIYNFAQYSRGPDVSEVGTTWIGSLTSMNALRAYQQTEINEMGGEQTYIPEIWRSGLLPEDPSVWAIPWTVYSLLLYYRKVWLTKVGIEDPAVALGGFSSFENTLERLKSAGAIYPWVPHILRSSRIVHEVVSWIWGAGGELISPHERKVGFNQEAAMEGLKAYYGLHKFIPSSLPLSGNPDEMFLKGETPLVISGPWLALDQLLGESILTQKVGVCKVPGTPYLGGSSLVIWRHSRQTEAALELVRYLTGLPVNIPFSPHASTLPARTYTMNQLEVETELNRILIESLAWGKSITPMRLWGMIEENLTSAFARIWADLMDTPSLEVDFVLHKHLDSLATRLNSTLAG